MLQPAAAQDFYADFEDTDGVNNPALWVPDNGGQAWGVAAFPGSGQGLKNLNEGCGTSGNTPLPGVTNFTDGIIQLDMSWEDDDSWGVILRKTADDAGYIVFFGYIETASVIIGDLANGCAPDGTCLDGTSCEGGGGEIIQVDHGLGGGLTQDLSVSYTGRIEVKGNTIRVWYLPTADIADPLGDLGDPLVEIQDDAHTGPGSVGIWHESQGGSMIDNVMVLVGDPGAAGSPSPGNGAVDASRDVILDWAPGDFAPAVNGHRVFLGEVFNDVNDALDGIAQDANSYDPGRLEFGTTYYWRVDEVNGPPDRTVFKGDVWNFTVEPLSIPIEDIAATASSVSAANMGPEKTIDGSGLNELDQHGSEGDAMWLSGPGAGAWIQYDFDRVYKLDSLLVWNSNQLVESFIGLGAKDVVIETSVDGTEWTVLEGATLFNQATGRADYTANTTIAFGGILAQFVRITINAGYGMIPQFGLSEVRFLYIPTFAREPEPASGSTVNSANVQLGWRSGREAASSEVYLGTDAADLALLGTTSENSMSASGLSYSTTYYWSVTEVNNAEAVTSYAGDVWGFTTPDFGTVDDFDQYDDNCKRIFFAWEDGLGHSGGEEVDGCNVAPSNGNGGGSIVGNETAPFAEKTIVNAGSTQSLPFNYDNSFGPSEAVLRLGGQDWTASGVQTLSLFFYGTAGNTGTLYVKINNSKILYDRNPADIAVAGWLAWNIDLNAVGGLQNVTSLTLGVDGASAAGMLYFDDIRLYPLAGELLTPADPGTAGLVALYSFEGNANDSSGNGHHGTIEGGASIVSGHDGSALDCAGFDGFVSTGRTASDLGINGSNPRTVACWAFTRSFNNGGLYDVGARVDGQDFSLRTLDTDGNWRTQYWGGAFDIDFTLDATDKWVHFTHVYDGARTTIYANGILIVDEATTLDTQDTNPWQIGRYGWPDAYFDGLIDELHLYNRALSAEEALFMAGRTDPIHKPL